MAAIDMTALTKVFPGGVRAVDHLDLGIADGEFFALLGPSGCGKTTLLRTIAGLESVTGGALEIAGRDVTNLTPGERDLAMVFQDYALFPHMTVQENIAYPLRIQKVGKRERLGQAADSGSGLGLQDLMERYPAQLSGGQQQRVALARAIASRPTVFLLDEPLSNLDARLRLEARTLLKRLQHELGVTTVYVTHDQAEALALADRIAVMHSGRIRQLGTPKEVFHRPADTFVANFIGSTPMNLLDARVEGDTLAVAGATVPLPAGVCGQVGDGDDVVFGARPEYVALAREARPHAIQGTVAIVENLGTTYLVSLETADGSTVQLTVQEGEEPSVGEAAWAVPARDRMLVYRGSDCTLVRGDERGEPTGHVGERGGKASASGGRPDREATV